MTRHPGFAAFFMWTIARCGSLIHWIVRAAVTMSNLLLNLSPSVRISAPSKRKFPISAILLNGDCQVGIVAIDTQRHTVRAHCFCDISGDRTRAATNIEDVHSGAQDSRKIGMIPLQSASIKDLWIGAVRLLAHLPSFMIP